MSLVLIEQAVLDKLETTLSKSVDLISRYEDKLTTLSQESEQDKMLTIEEACQLLRIKPGTLSYYYRECGLPYYKKGKNGVWFRKGDIQEWLATGKVNRRA